MPKVSVIMNCLNGAEYLPEALDSVMAQTFEDWEVVFYDNASCDRSPDIARKYGERVKYFRGTETVPLGAARNLAISRALGEFIAFLDTDDRWLPEKLALQVEAMERVPDVGLVYTNCYHLDSRTGNMRLALRSAQPEGLAFRSFLRRYPINLQTVMVRVSALERLDELFDPDLDVSEEYDLFLRLLYREKAKYIDVPTAVYRIHPAMSSIRKIAKFPNENRRVLEKLRERIPNFDADYASEVSYFEAKIEYWRANALMSAGDRCGARVALALVAERGLVFRLLYLITFLPMWCWNLAQYLRRRGIQI